jgi:hypothetical protein
MEALLSDVGLVLCIVRNHLEPSKSTDFFVFYHFLRRNFTFIPLEEIFPVLDPLLGVICPSTEVTLLCAMGCGAEQRFALALAGRAGS